MYSKAAYLALVLAGTSVQARAQYGQPPVVPPLDQYENEYAPPQPTGGGVYAPPQQGTAPPPGATAPPIPSGTGSGNAPVTTDNCYVQTQQGVAVTCAETPNFASTLNNAAPTGGLYQRRNLAHYGQNSDVAIGTAPSACPPSGTATAQRPVCYKFILAYQGEHGPVDNQVFPCYLVDGVPGVPGWQYSGSSNWPQPTATEGVYGPGTGTPEQPTPPEGVYGPGTGTPEQPTPIEGVYGPATGNANPPPAQQQGDTAYTPPAPNPPPAQPQGYNAYTPPARPQRPQGYNAYAPPKRALENLHFTGKVEDIVEKDSEGKPVREYIQAK